MNKKLYVLFAAALVTLPLYAGAGLVTLGGTTPQTAITSPYTTSCVANFPNAFYEGQSFRAYETQTPNTLASSREMLDTTNTRIYNPYNALGNTVTSNTLGGLLPAFTYRSNGRPGTTHFNFGGINTIMVYKQNDYTYTTRPSPNPSRANIAAQIVHNLHRRQISTRGGSPYNMTYVNINSIGGSFVANPSARFPTVNDYECQNFYIAKCGDGVQDNINKPGTATTNGKYGILVNGSILPRRSVAPTEECDGSDGTPSGYTCDNTCHLVQNITNPTCTLTPSQTGACGTTFTLNYSSTNTTTISNLMNIGAGVIQPNAAGSFTVNPTQTTTYSFRVNGAPGTQPMTCSALVTVTPNPEPNCVIGPNQTITLGQSALVQYNSSGVVNFSNLINIPAGVTLTPNQLGSFTVTPTQTTTYGFTAVGAACTTPKVCTGTITVTSVPQPHLRIDKTLINNTPYHSGDLVSFRIDFGNNGTGIAHNVVLTDYLPVSLQYISSHLYGVTPPYNFGTGMLGPNMGIIYSGFNLAPGQTGYIIVTGQLMALELCDRTLNTSFIESSEVQPPLYDAALFACDITTTNLSIDKTINRQLFYPNEYINFSIAVTNNGPSVAQLVKIGDIRPSLNCILPGATWSSNLPMTLTNPNTPYERTLNTTLAVGQTAYLYLTGQVANTPSCAGSYWNTGTLTYVVNNQTYTGQDAVDFIVPAESTGQCRELVLHGSNIVLAEEDDGRFIGDADFSCYPTNPTASTIAIDCGNGEVHTGTNVTRLDTTCHFDESSIPRNRTVQCYVDGQTCEACTQRMIIDQANFGVCGDGILQGYEDCDLGENNAEIFNYLDEQRDVRAGEYANDGYICHNCDIRKDNTAIPMAACFSLNNNNISIQEDELLPFRWKVDVMGNDLSTDDDGDCTPGEINEESMQCEFRIFNGELPESGEGNNLGDYNAPTVKTITIPCKTDMWTNNGNFGEPKELFKYFYNQRYTNNIRSLQNPFGRYYLDFGNIDLDGVYGEYNIALYQVRYEYCNADRERVDGTPIDRVCETDFAVTKPYLAQKSSFGLTPKSTTINLDGYEDIFGNDIIKKTDLDKIMVLDADEYKGGSNVNALMTSFINKYSKLAIAVDKNKVPSLNKPGITSIKVVPQQKIYILEGKAGTTVTLNPNLVSDTPFTIVTRNINLVVEGDLTTNGMFLVNGGTITFQEPDTNRCAHTQTVQGIFVTNKGFAADEEGLSNDATSKTRCPFGGLHIKGVLIGNNIQTLVESRRSQLNHWFYAGSSSDASVLAERRNEIFKGASVLIEYSPSLRTALPPGANEFTKALDVYKK